MHMTMVKYSVVALFYCAHFVHSVILLVYFSAISSVFKNLMLCTIIFMFVQVALRDNR